MAGSPDADTTDARGPAMLIYSNSAFATATMSRLNQMRKSGQFCDVVLQVGFCFSLGLWI
jgi:hypothetical protein